MRMLQEMEGSKIVREEAADFRRLCINMRVKFHEMTPEERSTLRLNSWAFCDVAKCLPDHAGEWTATHSACVMHSLAALRCMVATEIIIKAPRAPRPGPPEPVKQTESAESPKVALPASPSDDEDDEKPHMSTSRLLNAEKQIRALKESVAKITATQQAWEAEGGRMRKMREDIVELAHFAEFFTRGGGEKYPTQLQSQTGTPDNTTIRTQAAAPKTAGGRGRGTKRSRHGIGW